MIMKLDIQTPDNKKIDKKWKENLKKWKEEGKRVEELNEE